MKENEHINYDMTLYNEMINKYVDISEGISISLYVELQRIAIGLLRCSGKINGNGYLKIKDKIGDKGITYYVIDNLIYRIDKGKELPKHLSPIGFIPERDVSPDCESQILKQYANTLLISNPMLIEDIYDLITPDENSVSCYSVVLLSEEDYDWSDESIVGEIKVKKV